MVGELSQKARLPVEQVMVMDASRRTTRANAYFTGLGRTKRIVLYDTLLENYPPDQVKSVVAHEMAHWRQGHIVRGLAWGTLANFIFWGFLFIALRATIPPSVFVQPYTWAVILLFFILVSFVGSPVQNHLYRSMEIEADRVSVMLTGDAPAAVRLQVNLAVKNLSDVSPPAFIQWFSYSHPSAPDRIKIIKQAGSDF
jgi:STE24 endopeptidase